MTSRGDHHRPELAAHLCGQGECRQDHRGDAAYEQARREYLLERARARRAKAA